MFLLISDAITAILATFGMSAAIFSVVFAWKARREAQRQKELDQLSQDLGLSILPKNSLGLARQLQEFDLFSRERSSWRRKGNISSILRGSIDGTDVYLFDYTYVISNGKSSRRITQTVFFANEKNWYLPKFKMRPETWWHKVLAKLAWKSDINFTDSPDFSEKFWLTGEIEQLIRQQFTPALQNLLTDRPPAHLEGNNYYLIAYKPGKTLAPDAARTFFEHCCELVWMLKKEGHTDLLDLAEWQKEKEKMDPIVIARKAE